MRRLQEGSSLGEQLIMLALVAFFMVLVIVTFSYSVAAGVTVVATALGVGVAVFGFGIRRDRLIERRREQRCMDEAGRAAAALNTTIDATFVGLGPAGPAVFAIAGAARKVIYARDGMPHVHVTVLDFERIDSAFARPDGKRYRLEVRARTGNDSPREAVFLTVEIRGEAERWVNALQAYLNGKVTMV